MNDSDLESLIAGISEIELLERESLRIARDPSCLGLSRLEAFAADSQSPTRSDRSHLDACRICSLRLRAFRGEVVSAAPRRTSGRIAAVVLRGAAMAAAACLALLMWQRPAATVAPVTGDIPINIEYTTHAALADERCVASFRNTTGEDCVVLAVFRAWDSTCQCRQWQLYEWEHGASLARAVAGKPLDISIDMTNMPAIEQLLVVALARRAGDLPGSEAGTEALLACLNSSPLETEHPDDIRGFASAVESCLPPGVTVVSQAFSSE